MYIFKISNWIIRLKININILIKELVKMHKACQEKDIQEKK